VTRMASTPDPPIAWPASSYPPAVTQGHPFIMYAPGPRALRARLPRYLRPGLRVLDIGCGIGIGACHLAASGARGLTYTGVDPDPSACRQARNVLQALSGDQIQGQIAERSLQEHLDARPPAVDLILWTYSFHDCVDVTAEDSHAAVCAAIAALLRPGGHLILLDAGFAPGATADEVERTYAYMEKIIGHSDRGRYFPHGEIARLLTGAGLTLLEEQDLPLVALAGYLGLRHARAVLLVLGR